MSLRFLIGFLLIFTFSVYGQNQNNTESTSIKNDILNTSLIRDGIYKNYVEFRKNTPSKHGIKIKLVSKDTHYNIFNFSFVDSLDNSIAFEDEIWGLAYNGTIFLNFKIFKKEGYVKSNSLFTPLRLGRYCYFSNQYSANATDLFKDVEMAVVPLWPTIHKMVNEQYSMNINNGHIFTLDKTTLKTIVQNDAELFAVIDEKLYRNPEIYWDLLKRYNDRNSQQIKEIE
jgi:hypothetical protein